MPARIERHYEDETEPELLELVDPGEAGFVRKEATGRSAAYLILVACAEDDSASDVLIFPVPADKTAAELAQDDALLTTIQPTDRLRIEHMQQATVTINGDPDFAETQIVAVHFDIAAGG